MKKTVEERRDELLGKEFETNNCGKCFIIDYKGYHNVTVMFYNPVYITKTEIGILQKGNVKNPLFPTYLGKGYFGIGRYGGANHKVIYELWTGIIDRAYNEKRRPKIPTYKDVIVCDEWHNFQNFAEWCESQEFFGSKDDKGKVYALDKDTLSGGSKVYSPETCCFVPRAINNLFTKRGNARGSCLIGVTRSAENKFLAQHNYFGGKKHLGSFGTEIEAFQAYKKAKESYIKVVAEIWKGKIDDKVYQALLNYEVSVND